MPAMSTHAMARRDILKLAGVLSASSMAAPGEVLGALAPAQAPDPQAARRRELYGLLGDLPDRHRAVTATKTTERERDGYVLERWELDLNGMEVVPAYVARPREASGPRPAVVFNHSHGGGYAIGKTEFIEGRSYLQPVPYAQALTGQGYVALCIDHWVFGERSHATELDTFKEMLWRGRVLWGHMIFDSLKAVDWLVTRPDVDPNRVATLGMSMGSSMAQYLAALDPRIKVAVDICCLVDYETLLAKHFQSHHGVYMYVPGLLKHFSSAQINALIAPRAHLSLTGLRDELEPADGVDIIDRELTRIYAEQGRPDHWKIVRYDVGHQETAAGRLEAMTFLQRFL
jgi:dienelactone hydrolase